MEPNDQALEAALARNLYGKPDGIAEHAQKIARYCRTSVATLAAQDDRDFAEGRIVFSSLS
jgi:hypothetical protein